MFPHKSFLLHPSSLLSPSSSTSEKPYTVQRGMAPQQTPATPITSSASTLAKALKLLPYALHDALLLRLDLPVP